jgi:ribosomal protein S18 acetylase RimI-like enzyme
MLNLFYGADSLQRQMTDGHTFLVCYRDGGAAGFASYSAMGEGIYKLHKLYVALTQQGYGIGRYMVDFIMKDVGEQGGAALRLNVNRYNSAAIAFYGKTGFTQAYDEDIDIGNGFFMNDHVLERSV